MTAAKPGPARTSARLQWLAALRGSRKASVGAALLALFALVALIGPFFVADPTAFLGVPLSSPSAAHLLGTTGQGQDVLAQTVVGARASLAGGVVVGALVVLIGAVVGIAAGYFGGRVDGALSLVLNVFLVLPGLPLAIVIASYLPSGSATVAFVLVITGWAWNARVFRSQALMLRNREFVAAAIVGGESHLRVMLREILPNMTSLIVAQFIGGTVYALGAQVGLEFLGLGDVSAVTWGTNLYWASNDSALLTGAWWTFVPTGVSVALTGFALTMVNFAIDEVTNPRLTAERNFARQLRAMAFGVGPSTPVVPDGN